jgi:hypothetical protein
MKREGQDSRSVREGETSNLIIISCELVTEVLSTGMSEDLMLIAKL